MCFDLAPTELFSILVDGHELLISDENNWPSVLQSFPPSLLVLLAALLPLGFKDCGASSRMPLCSVQGRRRPGDRPGSGVPLLATCACQGSAVGLAWTGDLRHTGWSTTLLLLFTHVFSIQFRGELRFSLRICFWCLACGFPYEAG